MMNLSFSCIWLKEARDTVSQCEPALMKFNEFFKWDIFSRRGILFTVQHTDNMHEYQACHRVMLPIGSVYSLHSLQRVFWRLSLLQQDEDSSGSRIKQMFLWCECTASWQWSNPYCSLSVPSLKMSDVPLCTNTRADVLTYVYTIYSQVLHRSCQDC